MSEALQPPPAPEPTLAETQATAERLRESGVPAAIAESVAAAGDVATAFDTRPTALESRVLDSLKSDLAELWADRLTDNERLLLEEVAADTASLITASVTQNIDTTAEWSAIKATLANVASIEVGRLVHGVEQAAIRAVLGLDVRAAGAPFLL